MLASKLVLQSLLSGEAVQLGDLVVDPSRPQNGSRRHPRQAEFIEPNDYTVAPSKRYHDFHHEETRSRLSAALAYVLTGSRKPTDMNSSVLSAKRVRTLTLRDSDGKFTQVLADDDAKRWFEAAIKKGKSCYFVVGIQTVLDAQLDSHQTAAKSEKGAAVDVAVSVAGNHNESQGVRFIAEHEQIYSVEYRKIEFGFLSSRSVENAELGKNQWKTFWRAKGQTGDDDIVEAHLAGDAIDGRLESELVDGQKTYFVGS